jgi:hypothetical protein
LLLQPEPRLSCAVYPPVASELLRFVSCARAVSRIASPPELRPNFARAEPRRFFARCRAAPHCLYDAAVFVMQELSCAALLQPFAMCPALPSSALPRIASCTSRCSTSPASRRPPPRVAYCRVARRAVRSPVVPTDQRRTRKSPHPPATDDSSSVARPTQQFDCRFGNRFDSVLRYKVNCRPVAHRSVRSRTKEFPVPRPRFLNMFSAGTRNCVLVSGME